MLNAQQKFEGRKNCIETLKKSHYRKDVNLEKGKARYSEISHCRVKKEALRMLSVKYNGTDV